jgi:polysaccharide pyruvyl transferase WcaK-like protein
MILAIVIFTRYIARIPIVMSNIGVGPLHTRRGHWLAGLILRQTSVLSVRDRKSYATCRQLGLTAEQVTLVPDAVFVNPPQLFVTPPPAAAAPDAPPLAAAPTARKLKLALNLNYDIENPANWETFQQNLADTLAALNQTHPIEVHTLPMQSHFKSMHDSRVLQEFCSRIPEIETHLHTTESPRDAAAIIHACDLLLAERLHALVMAAILGKPFVALIYDVKVQELVAGLEMQPYGIDINHPFDPHRLQAMVEQAIGEQCAIRQHLTQRSTALRTELRDYFEAMEGRIFPLKGQ